LVHTHPGGQPGPSVQDLEGEAALRPVLHERLAGLPHGRLILRPDGLDAALFVGERHTVPLEVQSVGEQLRIFRENDTDIDRLAETYQRQALAFGEPGQRQLRRLRIGVVGAGGTGSLVLQQLAHLGVQHFTIIDHDVLERTNLNRVVGTVAADVGRPKVEVATRVVHNINPDAVVQALQADVTDPLVLRRLLDTDVVLICTDSHGSRALLSQLAYQYLLPMINVGVSVLADSERGTQVQGVVHLLAPGLACLDCTGDLDPGKVMEELQTEAERQANPYISGAAVTQPAVISLNSVVAGLGVSLLLSTVTEMPLQARRLLLRLSEGSLQPGENRGRRGCPTCSNSPESRLAQGDRWTRPGRSR
ncbi:ThiF family adenylyltransferase, partial [Deinococcus sp.]|uniref:ThiF family adenylyltransferase n=1 Tax=Deinococcus sp. TaxID=47478 RepID=UPI0025E06119